MLKYLVYPVGPQAPLQKDAGLPEVLYHACKSCADILVTS